MDRRAGKKGDFVNYMVPVDQPLADSTWSSQSTDTVAYNIQRKTEANSAQDENKDFYCNVSAQVFVSTDKPMYKPGDIVFVQAYLLTIDKKLPLLSDDAGQTLVAPALTVMNDKDKVSVFTAIAAEASTAIAAESAASAAAKSESSTATAAAASAAKSESSTAAAAAVAIATSITASITASTVATTAAVCADGSR